MNRVRAKGNPTDWALLLNVQLCVLGPLGKNLLLFLGRLPAEDVLSEFIFLFIILHAFSPKTTPQEYTFPPVVIFASFEATKFNSKRCCMTEGSNWFLVLAK